MIYEFIKGEVEEIVSEREYNYSYKNSPIYNPVEALYPIFRNFYKAATGKKQ